MDNMATIELLTPFELAMGLKITPSIKPTWLDNTTAKQINQFTNSIIKKLVRDRQCQIEQLADRLHLVQECAKCSQARSITSFYFKWGENRYESHCKECIKNKKSSRYRELAKKECRRVAKGKTKINTVLVGSLTTEQINRFADIFSSSLKELIDCGKV